MQFSFLGTGPAKSSLYRPIFKSGWPFCLAAVPVFGSLSMPHGHLMGDQCRAGLVFLELRSFHGGYSLEEAAGYHTAGACDNPVGIGAHVGLSGASQIRPRLPKI